ncbi:MAG: oligosaccharide flippase family protein [Lachnospiraceae bacterium]
MNIKNLKTKYRNMPEPVKASFWYTICNILNKGIALFSMPVFTRILTENEYGTFTIFQSWYSIIIIFTSLNVFLNSYSKGLLLYKYDRNGFTSSQLSLTTTITLIFAVVYILCIDFWTKLLGLSPVLMVAMFAELLTMPALEFWSARERFDYKYKKYVAVTLLMSILSISCGVVAVLNMDYKAEARVYSDAFAKAIFSGVFFITIMIKGRTFFNKEYWKYALTFNLPLIPHYLSNYVLSQSDRLMIGYMAGKSQAAFYSVSYTISTMMLLIVSAINNSLIPYIYKAVDLEERKNIKKVTRPLIILVAFLCIITMVFAPEIILIFAGSKYADAVYIIPPVAGSVFYIFVYSLFSHIEYFYKKTGFISVATCISAIVNFIMNFIFIKLYGYYAAGYTTLVCYICLSLLHYVFYKKALKQNGQFEELYDIKLVVITSALLMAIMLLMVFIYGFPIARYGIIVVICIILFVKSRTLGSILKNLKNP